MTVADRTLAKLKRIYFAESYEEIRSTKFAAVDEALRKKEQAKPTPKPGASKGDANAQPPAAFDLAGNVKG